MPCHAANTSAVPASARANTLGNRSSHSTQRVSTRATLSLIHIYIQSLGILRDLRKAYGGDLTGTDADVFLRMMIAASLDVSGRARLWTGYPGFVSDPLVRYNMIKVFQMCIRDSSSAAW